MREFKVHTAEEKKNQFKYREEKEEELNLKQRADNEFDPSIFFSSSANEFYSFPYSNSIREFVCESAANTKRT